MTQKQINKNSKRSEDKRLGYPLLQVRKNGTFDVPLIICRGNGTHMKKRDNPVKNGTSGHPKLRVFWNFSQRT